MDSGKTSFTLAELRERPRAAIGKRRLTPAELRQRLTEMRMEMNRQMALIEGQSSSLLWLSHTVREVYRSHPEIADTDPGMELVRSAKTLLERAGIADPQHVFDRIKMLEIAPPEAKLEAKG